MRKRIVVGFAGGGGSSLAIAAALGVHPDAAINHWAPAILCHQANFPDCAHYLSDIFEIDPREVLPGEAIGLAWFSPDCRHHSKAKGGAPVSKRVRGLAWVVIQWAKLRRPDVIFMENVEEWLDWGPLVPAADDPGGRMVPDPLRRGETAQRWFRRLRACGYAVETRVSIAADFGDPTIRRRMLVIARRDGRPIVWPAPTHAKRAALAEAGDIRLGPLPRLKPHEPAASFIDFNRPCPSIFLTRAEARAIGCKRPLQPATLRRIARGTQRFTIAKADPFIVPVTHRGDERVYDVGDALRTATTAKRGEFALVAPVLTGCDLVAASLIRDFGGSVGSPLDAAVGAVTAGGGGKVALAEATLAGPFLADLAHGDFADRPGDRARDVEDAAGVVHAQGGNVAPASVFLEQANTGMVGHDAREPASTIVQKGCTQRVVAAQLSHFRTSNTAGGQGDVAAPLTVNVAGGNHHALLAAQLDTYYGSGSLAKGGGAADAGEPLRTATALARHSLIVAQLSAVADHGRRTRVLAFLRAHFGEPTEADIADPLGSVLARTRFGIVLLPPSPSWGGVARSGGVGMTGDVPAASDFPTLAAAPPVPPHEGPHEGEGGCVIAFIVDIGMRMLDPESELKAAMGWPRSYKLAVNAAGEKVSKTVITKLVGNGVCKNWAEAHVAANCGDLPWWGDGPADRRAA